MSGARASSTGSSKSIYAEALRNTPEELLEPILSTTIALLPRSEHNWLMGRASLEEVYRQIDDVIDLLLRVGRYIEVTVPYAEPRDERTRIWFPRHPSGEYPRVTRIPMAVHLVPA